MLFAPDRVHLGGAMIDQFFDVVVKQLCHERMNSI